MSALGINADVWNAKLNIHMPKTRSVQLSTHDMKVLQVCAVQPGMAALCDANIKGRGNTPAFYSQLLRRTLIPDERDYHPQCFVLNPVRCYYRCQG